MDVFANETLRCDTMANLAEPAAERGGGSVSGDIRSSVLLFAILGSKEFRRVSKRRSKSRATKVVRGDWSEATTMHSSNLPFPSHLCH